ncbi:MAG: hypothetical protein AAFX06_32240 [Planctomycetota bacterium]
MHTYARISPYSGRLYTPPPIWRQPMFWMFCVSLAYLIYSCQPANGEIVVESTEQRSLVVAEKDAQPVGGALLLPAGTRPQVVAAAVVEVSGLADFCPQKVRLSASDGRRRRLPKPIALPIVAESETRCFIVYGASEIWLSIRAVDFKAERLEDEEFVITVGPSPPDDPQPDTPDEPKPDDSIPADPFDDIGRRVDAWAFGLPGRSIVAGYFAECAKALKSDPTKTINDVGEQLTRKLAGADDATAYREFRQRLSADIGPRFESLDRGALAQYFEAIARGLRAGQ